MIQWYKDGKSIEESGISYAVKTEGTRSTLKINPTKDTDFGAYTCMVSSFTALIQYNANKNTKIVTYSAGSANWVLVSYTLSDLK